jgi:hypothetical protein
LIASVTAKRPRVVLEHILEHGFVTTEELATLYGYQHPPRAARDVRELGIPLETFSVKSSDGRSIAAYRFDSVALSIAGQAGRRSFPKAFKKRLLELQSGKCAVCSQPFPPRYLQIDHRIPYLVAADTDSFALLETEHYMLVCGSCNRAKSWSCEHCTNGLALKQPALCLTCYWGNPNAYEHLALQPQRRLDITWSGNEATVYETLAQVAAERGMSLADYTKLLLKQLIERGAE